jgi:pyridoxamine 5'-phosphate oxidase
VTAEAEVLRSRLRADGIDERALADDPLDEFRRWFALAAEAGCVQHDAMAVATVGPDGAPSVRNVLLRGLDERGLVFYTNHHSAKGVALAHEGRVEALFSWLELDRQVRVTGVARTVTAAESDAYFASRPRLAQLGAHASDQSQPLESREELEVRVEALSREYGEGPIPRPAHWGGFRITPIRWELWQGRDGRLHDRIRYEPGGARWTRVRLNP